MFLYSFRKQFLPVVKLNSRIPQDTLPQGYVLCGQMGLQQLQGSCCQDGENWCPMLSRFLPCWNPALLFRSSSPTQSCRYLVGRGIPWSFEPRLQLDQSTRSKSLRTKTQMQKLFFCSAFEGGWRCSAAIPSLTVPGD